MSKFVRNDSGTVHSVDDGFVVPDGWDEVDESTARAEHPALFGEAEEPELPAPDPDEAPAPPAPPAPTEPAAPATSNESEAPK